jgi:hypothetical protein
MSEEKFNIPTELKEYLGVENDFDSVEQFKEYFSNEFIRKKDTPDPKAMFGKRFGEMGVQFRKAFREKYNLDIPNSEYENKVFEDFILESIDKIVGEKEAKLKDLETQITAPNEALKEWESKYTSLEKRYKEDKNALKSVMDEYNQYKEVKNNEFKTFKVSLKEKDIFSKIPFRSDLKEVERIGFDNLLKTKYKFDVTENDEFIVTDSQGNRIPNPKTVGTYLSPEDIVKTEAITNKLISENPHTDKPINNTKVTVKATEQTDKPTYGNKPLFGIPK